MSTFSMTGPRYHHGNLRTALLEAGFAAARTGGPAALQVRDLAASQGVSPSAVYRHFPDLAHLSAEVARLGREALARAMQDAAAVAERDACGARDRAIVRFRAIGEAYVRFACREPALFNTAFMVTGVPPSCADDPSPWTVLTNALDDLLAAGAMDAAQREAAPLIAWSAVHGLAGVLVRGMLPPPYDAPSAIRTVNDAVLAALGIRAGQRDG
jgi:AcrR family transcriptional regulator